MADIEKGSKPPSDVDGVKPTLREDEASLQLGDDTAILPEGQVDPVYEKKAKVLNRAVSLAFPALT